MTQDDRLRREVLAALAWEPGLHADDIQVVAEAGAVTLLGRVGTLAEKHAAEDAANGVRGVMLVVEEIEVEPADDDLRDDAEIAAAALDRLSSNSAIPADAVTVSVDDGWVTLGGQVDWGYQKAAAEHDVRPLLGVLGVTNDIAVRARVDVSNVSDEIMHALHRSWFFDPKTILVTAEGGRVTLSGTAKSPHDRQLAAATAWKAAGVTDVENNIEVA